VSIPERRPSSAELVRDVAVAGLQRAPAPPEHTLELERDRNGNILIRLAVRSSDLDALLERGETAFDRLCEEYPRSVNGGGE
jgi:hypothetical protein